MRSSRHEWMKLEYRAARTKPGKNNQREAPRLTVETVDNHIYFYADADSDRCLALMRTVRETDAQLRSEYLSRGLEGQPLTPMWLHIHSYG